MSGQDDTGLLRRAIAIAEAPVTRGGRPFGAVVCDGEGRVVSEAGSVAPINPRDWTAHSEMQALRAASAVMSWAASGNATIYASGEPSPMCVRVIDYGTANKRLADRAIRCVEREKQRRHHLKPELIL